MKYNTQRSTKLVQKVSSGLGLSLALLVGGLSAQAQTGTIEFEIGPRSDSTKPPTCEDLQAENLSLSYLRKSTEIISLLDEIKNAASLNCVTIKKVTEDGVVLYGPDYQKNKLKQIIALLDLPRAGINMEMWGIQLSSQNATAMAEAMGHINKVIDSKRKLMQKSYDKLQELAVGLPVQPEFKQSMSDLGYGQIFDPDHSPSLTDILLFILATDDRQAVVKMANDFNVWLKNNCKKDDNCKQVLKSKDAQPFHRFLEGRGLEYKGGMWIEVEEETEKVKHKEERHKRLLAVLNFALQYRLSQEDPNFDGRKLQDSADKFNDFLQDVINEINDDMQELFVEPTLKRIQEIAGDTDVSYAQVGEVSVVTLNGFETEVSAKSVSAFDVTPPIKLSELLKNANTISSDLNKLIPASGQVSPTNVVPISSIVGLVGAFGEQDTKWSDLTTGVSLKMTPNVLRDNTSAELLVDLTTGPGDPQAIGTEGGESPVSRVSQHNVKTNIYLKTLDLFTFSTFDNQSTKDGGRGYIPIVGKIWQGFFSGLPVVGNLFSWKKDPQNVYHQSIVLANTMITPTAMGIANAYGVEQDSDSSSNSNQPWQYQYQYSDASQSLLQPTPPSSCTTLKYYKEQLEILQNKKLFGNDKKLLEDQRKNEIEQLKAQIEFQQPRCFEALKRIVQEYKTYIRGQRQQKNGNSPSNETTPSDNLTNPNGVNKNGRTEFQYNSPSSPKEGDKKPDS